MCICSEHFTRKYCAKRHNITIHNNVGEIVTSVEYLVRRFSGRYHASDPSGYDRGNKLGRTVGMMPRTHQVVLNQFNFGQIENKNLDCSYLKTSLGPSSQLNSRLKVVSSIMHFTETESSGRYYRRTNMFLSMYFSLGSDILFDSTQSGKVIPIPNRRL